ncbi:MAG: glutaminase A [Cyanobacteria bacterium RI_101]|nr:glutaminase A [Cyanobacteria bacterium RI_101]
MRSWRAISLPTWRRWSETARRKSQAGRLPRYIPQLQTVDPRRWALWVGDTSQTLYSEGEAAPFSLMSVVKPFVLLYLFNLYPEETVRQWVGFQASAYPYHSLEQLQADGGFPRNACLNSGAITLADKLPGADPEERLKTFQDWFGSLGPISLTLDAELLHSVETTPNPRNRALVELLTQTGRLNHPAAALATYNRLCCLTTTAPGLGRLACLLLPSSSLTGTESVRQTLEVAGLYEQSPDYTRRWGWRCKSGVSGAWLALAPEGDLALVCYSPPLSPDGHSLAALTLMEQLRGETA